MATANFTTKPPMRAILLMEVFLVLQNISQNAKIHIRMPSHRLSSTSISAFYSTPL
jgi:hypothetical protein